MNEETRLLYRWIAEVAAELELAVDIDEDLVHIILDLARDAAHDVTRPAAPLTTFLVGLAVGAGGNLESVAAKATELARARAHEDA